MVKKLIDIYFCDGSVIYDPFMGSGTTALSAVKSERKFVGYDISKEYIALSEKRLHAYLSQTKLAFAESK